jgi:integrase
MARQARDARLETREARKRLPVSKNNEALWKQIHRGLFAGYYKGTNGGTWYMRRRIEKDGKKIYEKTRLGIADDYQDADGISVLSYTQATRLIFEKAGQSVVTPQNYTVQQASDDYLAWFKAHSKSYDTTKKTVDAHILPKFKNRKLDSLTTAELTKWHQGLVTAREIPEDDPDALRRYRSTANRVLTVFKALLNHAWRHEKVKDNSAWQKVKPFPNVDGSRKIFLSQAQCKKLINVTQGDFRALIQAALYTGARSGELAILRVKDLDATEGTLNLQDGKTGARVIFLADEGNKFFQRQVLGKHPDELILTQNGQPWGKSHHIRAFNHAAKAAELPAETSFYALRHTYVSLAAKNGTPLQVLAENVGTSVRMIESNYGKYLNADRRAMLNRALPSFGLKADNVKAIR